MTNQNPTIGCEKCKDSGEDFAGWILTDRTAETPEEAFSPCECRLAKWEAEAEYKLLYNQLDDIARDIASQRKFGFDFEDVLYQKAEANAVHESQFHNLFALAQLRWNQS